MSEPTLETTQPAAPAQSSPAPVVAQDHYTGLTLEARRNQDAGQWEFGVNLSGAFVLLTTRKLGGVDDDIREAIQPGFKAARATAYERERLGLA